MAIKTFTAGSVLTASDTNTYLNNGGLVYITQLAFTAANTTTGAVVDNCFSSTYANYRLMVSCTSASGLNSVNLQYRVSSTNAATTYNTRGWYNFGTLTGYAPAAQTSWYLFDAGQTYAASGVIDIFQPNVATYTTGTCTAIEPVNLYAYNFTNTHGQATAYTGFRIVPSASTITGTVYVYGYRNA